MEKAAETKGARFVCLHGHFYQPPRENPWLEAVGREPSAEPDHDWNRRITNECYRPNAAARLVDDKNRVLRLRNNYEDLSFNFGPTLLHWLSANEPWVVEKLVEADRRNVERWGAGNALAQAYNHMILPLANRRDKETQIVWGIEDFRHRFGRLPEGMWLPETAVDPETLDIMAEKGLRFTILAPHQAARWRFVDRDDPWREASDGSIPTGRAYRYRCSNGKDLAIFFYDGAIARGIAFERLLEHSSKLLAAVQDAFRRSQAQEGEPWLVHAATDGESYGHHFKFGDMALAAVFQALETDQEIRAIPYSAFLERFPIRAEVEIVPNTAWSCAHGVGRWHTDCGCSTGAHPQWNQKWREPLREALNWLRDRMADHFEAAMDRLVRDPWAARNDYLRVVLDREGETRPFIERHQRRELSAEERLLLLELLEMQRAALYMFTSCGWFFDDVSGIETRIILSHACRALELLRRTGGPDLEPDFAVRLEKAESNVREYGTGADVYRTWVKPQAVSARLVAASIAMEGMALKEECRVRIHSFSYLPEQQITVSEHPVPCQAWSGTVTDRRTGRREKVLLALVHFGGLDFRCSTAVPESDRDWDRLLHALKGGAEEGTSGLVRAMDEVLGEDSLSLSDILEEPRLRIARHLAQDSLAFYTEFQKRYFYANKSLLWSLRQWGIELPADVQDSIRRVLEQEVVEVFQSFLTGVGDDAVEMEADNGDFRYRMVMARLGALRDSFSSWGLLTELSQATRCLIRAMNKKMVEAATGESRHIETVLQLAAIADVLHVSPRDWWVTTNWYALAGSPGLARWARCFDPQLARLRSVDRLLHCRFLDAFHP
jgi:alpha-amylase/alpha-mannosidase (GH57 family)